MFACQSLTLERIIHISICARNEHCDCEIGGLNPFSRDQTEFGVDILNVHKAVAAIYANVIAVNYINTFREDTSAGAMFVQMEGGGGRDASVVLVQRKRVNVYAKS